MEVTTKSPKETTDLGQKIASSLKGGETFALVGELGSGKTTFVKGLASGLGIEQRIISPTFIILRKYDVRSVTGIRSPVSDFYHIDLYRLEDNIESEVRNLGVEDVWSDPKNVVAVEWAEKVTGMLPGNTVWIKFENLGGDKRKIKVITDFKKTPTQSGRMS